MQFLLIWTHLCFKPNQFILSAQTQILHILTMCYIFGQFSIPATFLFSIFVYHYYLGCLLLCPQTQKQTPGMPHLIFPLYF